MPKREDTLRALLANHSQIKTGRLPRLTVGDIQASGHTHTVQETYEALGGTQPDFPVNPRATWDIEFEEFAVELDEQLHFNRYRATTLASKAYEEQPGFPRSKYLTFCSDYEEYCLRAGKHGGKWTNLSCEKQFGPSPNRGSLDGAGPARWRQRAFYDFLKDLSPQTLGFPVVRIAIWDAIEVDGAKLTVDQILRRPREQGAHAILSLIDERLGSRSL